MGDRFSLLRFYERRIRRIVPALLVVVLATLVAGWFLLQPGDYRALAESSVWSIGFVANVFFWLNTGYFDAARETMPLLHMWSLAVEEQFYLVWPFVVLVLVRWVGLRRPVGWVLLISALVASFVASIVMTESNPQAAFYSPLTRAWELGLGAVLALLMFTSFYHKLPAVLVSALGWVGLLLIAFALTQLSSDLPFPGYNAAYPVLGSCCLLVAGTGSGWVPRLLSTSPMVFVGKVSYSLYLWHWPVFVYFHHYANGQPMSPVEAVLLIALSFVLAVLSWRYVEQPLRKASWPRPKVFVGGFCASAFVLLVGVLIVATNGVPSRVPDAARQLADHRTMWDWPCPAKRAFDHVDRKRCVLGQPWDESTSHAVLWGDSHALHFAPLIDRVARRHGFSVFLFDSCAPYIDNKQVRRVRRNQAAYSEECGREYEEILSFLADDERVSLVVVAAAWAAYPKTIHGADDVRSEEVGLSLMETGLLRTAQRALKPGRDMLILTEVPRSDANLVDCMRTELGGLVRRGCDIDPYRVAVSDVEKVLAEVNQVIYDVAASRDDIEVIDTTRNMCGPSECSTVVNGEFIYRDTHHIRRNFSEVTMDTLIEAIGIETAMLADRSR